MSIPEVFFRETIDLNRYSNAVATNFQTTYNDIILVAAKKLKQLNIRQAEAGAGVVVAPETRKRLRAIIAQSKASLNTWSKTSTKQMIREIEGLADVQAGFIENELKKVVKSGNIPINSVAVSPKYAESFVTTDPTQTNIFTSKEFTEDDFKRFGQGKFELTARQGAMQTLPNGVTVEKAFRGIAERQQDSLARHIRQGVFSGESSAEIARRMVGKLEFGQRALSSRQKALAGGELTKLANHQIRTIVRTSVNQVQNQASQAVYAANSKVAPKYQYVATLDSRTSAVCRDLDGKTFAYNRGPTPPQHFNCRSTTVPVVDFDRLQKKYPTLEKPPVGKAVTRPSATGRVPQDTTYGEWLLKQDKKLQVKTLGNEKKVNYFKRLAKKEGSGQKAIKKLVRDDDSERSLKDLQRIYGKPTNIKPKPKPKAVVGTAKASDFIKSKPIEKLSNKDLIKDIKAYKKHLRDQAKAQGKKISPFDLGPYDTQIERLEQGLTAFDMTEADRAFTSGARLDYLYWRQKTYNKKPLRVKNISELKKRTDVVKAADGENLIIYRGVTDEKFANQFKGVGTKGAEHYAGNGIYGNGSYAAARNIHGPKSIVDKANNDALALAKTYAGEDLEYNMILSKAQTDKRVTAFALRKDANIKTWKAGSSTKTTRKSQFHAGPDGDWYKENFEVWKEETVKKAEKLTGLKYNSVGEAATALGIDAYQVPLPLTQMDEVTGVITRTTFDYWVILNRSAIIVSDTVGL
jgi:SPP1 gp7 family putative phage head morphogenesis protein